MVEEQIMSRGITDSATIDAFMKVPRHLFVEEALWGQAYSDYPLPIGQGQTISQPYIVALMTEGLELTESDRVLEIGTGSGYQAAILAEIAKFVYSIERRDDLAKKAKKILVELKYKNIEIRVDDGTQGWKDESPFDAIIVTASSPDIPSPLVEQLKDGGRMVIPVGGRVSQNLIKIRKVKGKIKKENMGGCRFVKLIGEYGWRD
jgi:protein-L-isoaspartate(D-aspartate) O-methyltransferase